MSERLTDEEYRAWIDAGSPNELEGWAIILALRARVAKLEAALTDDKERWFEIATAYKNLRAAATAHAAISEIDEAIREEAPNDG